MSERVTIVVDSRVRLRLVELSDDLAEQIRAEFTHDNPQHHKLKKLGFWPGKEKPVIRTWRHEPCFGGGQMLTVPRGGMQRVRDVLTEHGRSWRVADQRTGGDLDLVSWQSIPDCRRELWPHQQKAVDALLKAENCLVRAPTGSGKTEIVLAAISRVQLPALVIVWESGLLKQWQERLAVTLGIGEREVGLIRGKTFRLRPVTLAMQQTMNRLPEIRWELVNAAFGFVACDELSRWAASTFTKTVDRCRARYRVGVSADECVAAGSLVTMGDGSLIEIERIRQGDVVMTPLGPRVVLKSMFKGLRRTVRVGARGRSVRCTENTWFATGAGWLDYESLCYHSVYVDLQAMLRMRQTDAVSLQDSMAHKVQTEPVRFSGPVFDMRGGCSSRPREERASDASSRLDAVGEGQDETYGSSAHGDFRGSQATISGRSVRQGDVTGAGPRASRDACVEGEDGGNYKEAVCVGGADSIRRATMRKRGNSTSLRAESCACTEASRIRASVRCSDGKGSESSSPLQVGFCASRIEDSDRDRRQLTPWTERHRCSQESATFEAGLDDDPVQGDVRSLRAAGECCASTSVVVERDWLTVPTYDLSIDGAECFYADGFLVHNSRRDRKEFLIYDMFGREAAFDVSTDQLVSEGIIHDVEVRIVPTEFEADWYREAAEDDEKVADFNRLLDEMTVDEERNALAADLAAEHVEQGQQVLVFSHRVDHCRVLEQALTARGCRAGLIAGDDDELCEETKAGLRSRDREVGVGTFARIALGVDLPSVEVGVVTTPIHNNKQFAGQVRGRLARRAEGKRQAIMYYLWDRHVSGKQALINLKRWNKTAVVLHRDGALREWIPVKTYLKEVYDDEVEKRGRQAEGLPFVRSVR